MQEYFISIDFTETEPISYEELVSMAIDPGTDDEYADYLKYVLLKGKRLLKAVDGNIEDVEFGIHRTGCVVPFDEFTGHPYAQNFYTKIWMDKLL